MANNGFNSGTFASDADHFIYCAEGETVLVDVLATFVGGTDCDDCEHGARTWQWEVEGASSYTLVSEVYTVSKRSATFELSEAGDTITITAKVGSTSQGECYEDRHGNPGEHGGSHAGAEASCTIKLWRMDMAVGETSEDPEVEPYPLEPTVPSGNIYLTQFAKSATTTTTLVGAAPSDVEDWSWTSSIEAPAIHSTKTGGTSWSGKMVATTKISLVAKVQNGCAPTVTNFTTRDVEVRPTIRRPGWTTPTASDIPHLTMYDDDPSKFPQSGGMVKWGLNTNWNSEYADDSYSPIVVTPVYHIPSSFPTDFAEFDDVVDDVPSGPNVGLWFNKEPTIFRVDRVAKINHWITTDAERPAHIPSTGPNGIQDIENYHDIYVKLNSDQCGCIDPLEHDGIGGNYIYQSQLWHETIGCPESDNQAALGHHVLMRNGIVKTPELYDPVYQADVVWRHSKELTRNADAGIQVATSTALASRMETLHQFIGSGVEYHNFYGSVWVYNGGTSWIGVSGWYNGGW